MPPKGYKRGYIKDKNGDYIDPRLLESPEKKDIDNYNSLDPIIEKPIKDKSKPARKIKDKGKPAPTIPQKLVEVEVIKSKKDTSPLMKGISPEDSKNHTQVIISWKDSKGKSRITSYTMNDMNLQESISEEFTGASKKTRMHLSIDGSVLEKG